MGSLRLLPLAFCLLPLAFSASAADAQISVRATLDRQQVAVGENAALTVEVTGTQQAAAPSVAAVDGLTVRYLGPATQVSIVNGQISASIRHRYSVTPTREDTFVLGPFVVEHDGKQYRTGTLRLTATEAATGRGGLRSRAAATDELSLHLEMPRQQVFVQEEFPLTVTLVIGSVSVDDLQYPTLAHEGFTVEGFPKPTQARETQQGRAVQVLRFQTKAVALRPGALELGPAEMQLSVLERGRGRNDIFDRFFGSDLFAEKRPILLRSDPRQLDVRPLPKEGRPSDFTGAVGQFRLDVTAQPREVGVGDPITLQMRLSGQGNMAQVDVPHMDTGVDFKVYPPQASTDAASGAKVFEQVLIPAHDGVRHVPEIRFSYFDPAAGSYRTATAGPFPITVAAAAQPQMPKIVQGPGAADEAAPVPERLGRDIVYIKEAPGELRPIGYRFYGRPWFLLAQMLPLLLFAGSNWVARRRARLHGDPGYARFVRAGREAHAALGEAKRALREGDSVRFDDVLSRTVRDYLGAKLDLPPGAVEPQRVAERLDHRGKHRQVAESVRQLFDLLERSRYAPTALAPEDRDEALRLAAAIVGALESRRGGVRSAAMALALIPALLSLSAHATSPSPAALFHEGNGAYARGDFAPAREKYAGVLEAGVESAAVHYNLGNVHMKMGRPGAAILHYERARRLAPRDADVRANLRFARQEQDLQSAASIWTRMLLPLGERCATGELALLAGGAYWILLLAWSARVLWPATRIVAARVAMACVTVLLLAAPALAYRVVRYDVAQTVVVTRSGEVAVRFEPSPDGTTHFVTREGTLLQVEAERPGWLQIRREDGRRGWVPQDAVEAI